MTESIGTQLTTLLHSILPFYLSEAETESYPYAVYNQTVTEHRTKDGVYKIVADASIEVYAKDFDTAYTKATAVKTAIVSGMSSGQYIASLRSEDKDCTEGVWCIELTYTIKQNS